MLLTAPSAPVVIIIIIIIINIIIIIIIIIININVIIRLSLPLMQEMLLSLGTQPVLYGTPCILFRPQYN